MASASSSLANDREIGIAVDSREPSAFHWIGFHLIAFRFIFSYVLLYILPFPFGSYPGSIFPFPFQAYDKVWFALVPWVGKHVLHVSYPITVFPNGSGDTTFNYVQLLCYVALASVATLVWTLLDRNRPNYRTLYQWLRIYVRYALAFTMLAYGMAKVIKLQFPALDLQHLTEPLGNYSPFSLLWTFLGSSTLYTHFAGSGEVIGGLLLFVRRTTTLGAIVIAGVMMNVAMLNFSYDVPVKIFATHLILLAVFLIAPDLRRVTDMLVLNRPTAAANLSFPMTGGRIARMATIARFGKAVVLAIALYFFTVPYVRSEHRRASIPRSPIYGVYRVETFQQTGKTPTPNEAQHWRELIFDYKEEMSVLAMDDSGKDYGTSYDEANQRITISEEDKSKAKVGEVFYSWIDAKHLLLHGNVMGEPMTMQLLKVDMSRFTLLNRGFHWINEHPFHG